MASVLALALANFADWLMAPVPGARERQDRAAGHAVGVIAADIRARKILVQRGTAHPGMFSSRLTLLAAQFAHPYGEAVFGMDRYTSRDGFTLTRTLHARCTVSAETGAERSNS